MNRTFTERFMIALGKYAALLSAGIVLGYLLAHGVVAAYVDFGPGGVVLILLLAFFLWAAGWLAWSVTEYDTEEPQRLRINITRNPHRKDNYPA